jgi:hypothetical protein
MGASSTGDTEEIDALPVLVDGPTVVRASFPRALPSDQRSAGAVVPAVQAAAVAATGFVAGAAVVGLMHRSRHRRDFVRARSRRRLGGRGRGNGSRTAGELLQIVGSRSLLVDVHLLGGRD